MRIRPVGYDEAAALTAAMVTELSHRYGGDGASPADASDFEPPHGVFLVAAVDGVDVACGGLRRLNDTTGEVKRMYAAPAVRGQGVGRAVLRGLVDRARATGLEQVWLETGTLQPEAIALYTSEGFEPIPPYGHFKDEPLSRCFALTL